MIFASLFPPHMRQGLDDEARGGDGGSRGNGEDGSDGNADSVSEGRTRDGEDGGTINDVQLTANGDADAD